MTNEEKEAVLHCLRAMIDEELCEECPLYGTTGSDHCEKDCVRLAIEALEQKPCEDCISKTEVKRIVDFYKEQIDGIYRINESVDNLPPVTPQPKQRTGHWIDIKNKRGTVIAARCSCCEKSPKHAIRSDFCPNCGAKMQGRRKHAEEVLLF
jgi:hypothetical protein